MRGSAACKLRHAAALCHVLLSPLSGQPEPPSFLGLWLPSLSPRIHRLRSLQARALRHELAKLNLPPDTLWITSPLQRAMQTLLLACPHSHLLGGGGGCTGSASAENSSALPNGGGGVAPRVAVLHTITEKVGVARGTVQAAAWVEPPS